MPDLLLLVLVPSSFKHADPGLQPLPRHGTREELVSLYHRERKERERERSRSPVRLPEVGASSQSGQIKRYPQSVKMRGQVDQFIDENNINAEAATKIRTLSASA